ncbi:hypothetical protein IW139_006785, partial [Coemansia sp. RSA 353]
VWHGQNRQTRWHGWGLAGRRSRSPARRRRSGGRACFTSTGGTRWTWATSRAARSALPTATRTAA